MCIRDRCFNGNGDRKLVERGPKAIRVPEGSREMAPRTDSGQLACPGYSLGACPRKVQDGEEGAPR
eukprot:14988605-Alexandrium_andersonii.AAC.1